MVGVAKSSRALQVWMFSGSGEVVPASGLHPRQTTGALTLGKESS